MRETAPANEPPGWKTKHIRDDGTVLYDDEADRASAEHYDRIDARRAALTAAQRELIARYWAKRLAEYRRRTASRRRQLSTGGQSCDFTGDWLAAGRYAAATVSVQCSTGGRTRSRSRGAGRPARRAGASSCTSSADPPSDDSDLETPRLAVAPPPRATYSYGCLSANQRGEVAS